MRHDDGCGVSSVILAFLLGSITGAGLAMLFSPYSGEDTRQRINDLTGDLYSKKDDIASEARERFSDAVEKGKDFISEQKDVIGSALDAGKGAYKKEKEKLSESDA